MTPAGAPPQRATATSLDPDVAGDNREQHPTRRPPHERDPRPVPDGRHPRQDHPILLAAIGGGFTQVGGILNIGLEGMMLMSAFAGIAVGATANPLLGVVAALGSAVLLALVYAVANLVR